VTPAREARNDAGLAAVGDIARSAAVPESRIIQRGAAPDSRLVEEARRRLLDLISAGALRAGDRLGTERELAVRLSVSRSTLRQVLAVLAQSGIIRRVPGRAGGTFVAHGKVDRDLSVIVGLPEYLRRQGFQAGTQVLSATIAGADAVTAAGLSVPAGSLVLDITRIRLADAIPLSLERARFPADLFPGLLELPLGGSIYDLLDEHYGVRPEEVVEHLEVAGASADQAALLGVPPGAPLLAITRTSATSGGPAFEFSSDLFRADRTCVTFRTRAQRAEIASRDAQAPGHAPASGSSS
jgi:GntR family transcriptional regulator